MTITHDVARRTVLRGAAAVAAGGALAACGSSDTTTAATGSTTASPTTTATAIGSFSQAPAAPVESSDATDGASAANALGNSADVAVGSGVIYEASKVVVTQPTAGEFKCFTAVCTHQGCLVSQIRNSEIVCACHGSSFSITDGSVIQGPASAALAEEKITVSDGTIKLG